MRSYELQMTETAPAGVLADGDDFSMILDDKEIYHFGASLNNLGRHYCAVTKMDAMFIPSIMQRI